MDKVSDRAAAAELAFKQVLNGTHIAVPVGLLKLLARAANVTYDPAWGGDATEAWDAGRAAGNILKRHAKLPTGDTASATIRAAAPDLLAACKRMVNNDDADARSEGERAIANAEGRPLD